MVIWTGRGVFKKSEYFIHSSTSFYLSDQAWGVNNPEILDCLTLIS